VRAKEFYAGTLGLRLVEENSFALVFDANGTMLRVTTVPELTPHNFTVLGWEVEHIRAAITSLIGRGVQFERYSFLTQDERGIWTAPGGAQVAWFKDPDGNVLSISEV
jgi:catechol 2,3-dioxygenase-like lactoylglutathione lyase family enzyme